MIGSRLRAVAGALLAALLLPGLPVAQPRPDAVFPAPVTGRIIVRLTEDGARALRAGALDLPTPPGGEVLSPRVEPMFVSRHGSLGRFAVLTFTPDRAARPGLSDNTPWLAALRSDPRVEGVSPDAAMPVTDLPDDPYLLGEGGLPPQFPIVNDGGLSLHAATAWPFVPYGRVVPVGIVDSGVDWEHPDLGGPDPPGGVLWINEAERDGTDDVDDDGNVFVDDVIGWDFVDARSLGYSVYQGEDGGDPDNDPRDFAGHGTLVAGLVTAVTDNGVGIAGTAREFARLMPVRAGWLYNGVDAVVFMGYTAQAIEYAAIMGARVINGSWDSAKCDTQCPEDQYGLEAALDFAINQHDVVVVGSAGNGGTSTPPCCSRGAQYMAQRSDVLGVGGVRPNGTKATQSNYGPWVSLAAFYDGMPSTHYHWSSPEEKSTYAKLGVGFTPGGTSFSSPQVAGAAAVCRAVDPSADAAAIRDALVSTAQDLTEIDPTFGHLLGGGLVDIAAAVQALGGGWDAAGNGVELTPWGAGRVAQAGTAMFDPVCVLDVAVRPEGGCATPEESSLPPVVARGWPGGPVLVFTTPDQVVAYRDDGSAPIGWPVAVPAQPRQLTTADLDGDGSDEVLVLAGSDLHVIGLDGTPTVVAGWVAARICVGDFDPGLSGLEIVGVTDYGEVAALDAGLQSLPDWTGTLAGSNLAAPPVAVELDGHGTGALVALMAVRGKDEVPEETKLHVVRGETATEVSLPGGWYAVNPVGFAASTRVGIVAVGGTRMALLDSELGEPDYVETGGPIAGEVLCADVDGDGNADLVALRRDGVLMAWHEDLTPVSGFPRVFPTTFTQGPVVVDEMVTAKGAGRAAVSVPARYLLLSGDDGSLWSLPFDGWGQPAPWPNAGGDAGRTRFLDFARATPVEATAALTWEWGESRGRACWTLSGDPASVTGLRLTMPDRGSVRVVWSGPAEAACAEVSDAIAGGRLTLEARSREGVWSPLARVTIPGRSALVLLPAYPNPFRGSVGFAYHAATGAPVDLMIHDAGGRLVHRAALPSGNGLHRWDGLDGSGRPVAAGSYFARLRQGGDERRLRFLRVP